MDNIEEIIKKKLNFTASVKLHERILDDVLDAQEKSKNIKPAIQEPNIWRVIMKNPITKFTVAAIVVIACVIGISFWRTTGSGIALADVLAQMEKVNVYLTQWEHSCTYICTEDPNESFNIAQRRTTLVSQEYGQKMTIEELDPNGQWKKCDEQYISPECRTRIDISYDQKKYTFEEFQDDWLKRRLGRSSGDPLNLVKGILSCKYESLGRSTIEGIEVEGFRTTDPNWLGDPQGVSQVDVRIFVDVKTRLPVQWQEDFVEVDSMANQSRTHAFGRDYGRQAVVDAGEFKPPSVPKDYTSAVVRWPACTEATAIQGLRLRADLFGRSTPLIMKNIADLTERGSILRPFIERSETPTAMQLKEELKGLTDKEINNKLAEFIMPIRGLAGFYRMLEWDNKEPRYNRLTVVPKDADKILMRWKLSDNQYRVVYGDLRAETITSERLAEFEKPLHEAVLAGNIERVRMLISNGADIREKDKSGFTPLHVAALNGRREIAELLIDQGADIEAKNNMGMTPLQVAARFGGLKVVELLISKGADIEAKDNRGMTSMHQLCFSHQGKATAELLISKGANINAKITDTNDGRTPLHVAAWSGNGPVAELLISKGVDINARENHGQTPLHRACLRLGRKNVVELLIAKGADINAKDNNGKTPLSLAKETKNDEIVELLRKHNAKE
jgi:ankyrin repeat protein